MSPVAEYLNFLIYLFILAVPCGLQDLSSKVQWATAVKLHNLNPRAPQNSLSFITIKKKYSSTYIFVLLYKCIYRINSNSLLEQRVVLLFSR